MGWNLPTSGGMYHRGNIFELSHFTFMVVIMVIIKVTAKKIANRYVYTHLEKGVRKYKFYILCIYQINKKKLIEMSLKG